MSPLDMLIFLFFILVTIKAATSCYEHWRDIDEAAERAASRRVRPSPSVVRTSRTVRIIRPSAVRVTPIKRVHAPAAAAVRNTTIARQTPLKDKGAA